MEECRGGATAQTTPTLFVKVWNLWIWVVSPPESGTVALVVRVSECALMQEW